MAVVPFTPYTASGMGAVLGLSVWPLLESRHSRDINAVGFPPGSLLSLEDVCVALRQFVSVIPT